MTKNVNEQEVIDISELKKKITDFSLGMIPEEKFNQFRLSRGVYGQRQTGSQMIRIKIPFGKLTTSQLRAIAEVSEKYANGNSHITTRQNIQYHYVKLSEAPKVWDELSKAGLTLREACGNTVRNITASAIAGIDPEEPFDVSPYSQVVYEYFIRNPICQELGRKVKIAFSSNQADSAFTYFNDIGFIPKLGNNEKRGFQVVIGGGLGAQSIVAKTVYDFLEENKIIPFIEAVLRVFDRYGERSNRNKARLKYLVKRIGIEAFINLINEEIKANKNKVFEISENEQEPLEIPEVEIDELHNEINDSDFQLWKKTNVFEQKQRNYFAVNVRVKLGNLNSDTARTLASLVEKYAADDIRLTINQGIVLKFIKEENLKGVFSGLSALGLADAGFDSTADITACPGTDTCNLGITNSTGLAKELGKIVFHEFPELLEEKFLKIKISGCMNSCGQHMAANIGLHGSSIKVDNKILPAMQVVLGGGIDPDGTGNIANRIRKIPTKRIPQMLRILLSDFEENGLEGEYFNSYYRRLGTNYFSTLVQPLENTETLKPEDFIDWGEVNNYVQSIGIGECAGVSFDVVSIMLEDTKEKLNLARKALAENEFADSIYHSYSVFVNTAKAILLSKDIKCNTQIGIIKDYQKLLLENSSNGNLDFENMVLQINKVDPTEKFAAQYFNDANTFTDSILSERENQILS